MHLFLLRLFPGTKTRDYSPNSFGVYSSFPYRSFFTAGFSHFESLLQLLHVGETEQLAVTFLFRTRYPADAEIPPKIKSLPAVLKKSFLFIILINYLLCGACYYSFQFSRRGCTFFASLFHSPG